VLEDDPDYFNFPGVSGVHSYNVFALSQCGALQGRINPDRLQFFEIQLGATASGKSQSEYQRKGKQVSFHGSLTRSVRCEI
jgi:hypothetical protein